MALWLAKEFDWDTGRYTGNYYDIAKAGIKAVFVDSFYGLDTNAGTAAAPFKTLSKAITTLNSTGANGSRIFMNGIFSETIGAQTYLYDYIGCGGGKNGKTVMYRDTISAVGPVFSGGRFLNIETVNYNGNFFLSILLGFLQTTKIANSYIKNCIASRTSGADNTILSYYYSILENVQNAGTGTPGTVIRIYNSLLINSANWNARINAAVNSFADTDVTSAAFNTANFNLKQIEPQFIKPTNGDYNVRITSPLLGAGPVDEITGRSSNVGGVQVGLPYNGITPEFTTEGGATITDLTIDASGKFTITAPATSGTLETALMDLGNIYPLENIDLFNVFDFLAGEITQGVFETFSSPRMALTIKLKYGLTSAEVGHCPWLLIEYGKQPTFSGTGASRVGNADDTFDPNTFQTITCRYMKLFVTLQNNS